MIVALMSKSSPCVVVCNADSASKFVDVFLHIACSSMTEWLAAGFVWRIFLAHFSVPSKPLHDNLVKTIPTHKCWVVFDRAEPVMVPRQGWHLSKFLELPVCISTRRCHSVLLDCSRKRKRFGVAIVFAC